MRLLANFLEVNQLFFHSNSTDFIFILKNLLVPNLNIKTLVCKKSMNCGTKFFRALKNFFTKMARLLTNL